MSIAAGWLSFDSGCPADAHSLYGEALAAARMADDAELEAHAFGCLSLLAKAQGRPREAVAAALRDRHHVHHELGVLPGRRLHSGESLGELPQRVRVQPHRPERPLIRLRQHQLRPRHLPRPAAAPAGLVEQHPGAQVGVQAVASGHRGKPRPAHDAPQSPPWTGGAPANRTPWTGWSPSSSRTSTWAKGAGRSRLRLIRPLDVEVQPLLTTPQPETHRVGTPRPRTRGGWHPVQLPSESADHLP